MFTEKSKNKLKKSKLDRPNFMPQDQESQKILYERANKLAKRAEVEFDKLNRVNYIRFRLGRNELYGILYSAAKEVIHNTTITKLPYVPNYIAGIINRRGALVTILDLKTFFHLQISDSDKDKYIIVTESQGMTVGILADFIEGSAAYDQDILAKSLPANDVINPEYILGLDQGITAILNIEAIMTNIRKQLELKE